jgi:phosphohistidine phosphatase
MQLYLLRHGIAVARGTEGFLGDADTRRRLTQEGVKKLMEAGRGMQRLELSVDEILSSPLPRAWETAQIAARALQRENRLVECPELAPGASQKGLIELLRQKRAGISLLLVGHEPDLSRLAALLLGAGSSEFLELKKGGLVKIELEFQHGRPHGVLDWMVTPRILRLLGQG